MRESRLAREFNAVARRCWLVTVRGLCPYGRSLSNRRSLWLERESRGLEPLDSEVALETNPVQAPDPAEKLETPSWL